MSSSVGFSTAMHDTSLMQICVTISFFGYIQVRLFNALGSECPCSAPSLFWSSFFVIFVVINLTTCTVVGVTSTALYEFGWDRTRRELCFHIERSSAFMHHDIGESTETSLCQPIFVQGKLNEHLPLSPARFQRPAIHSSIFVESTTYH